MLRIGQIHERLKLYRLDDDVETRLLRHAEITPGDVVIARSSIIAYGQVIYTIETVESLQRISNRRSVVLDISTGSSRERGDVINEDSIVNVFKKSLVDKQRHQAQIRSERKRGVQAVWGDKSFDCVIGARSRDVSFDTGGGERVYSAVAIANRRQFFHTKNHPDFDPLFPASIESAPETGDRIEIEDARYEIQAVTKDVGVLSLALAENLGYIGEDA